MTEVWKNNEARTKQIRYFTPHGEMHFRAVEHILFRLIPGKSHKKLTSYEKFLLLASAWLHDIGMLRGVLPGDITMEDAEIRETHHIRSEKFIGEKYREVGVLEREATAFGIMARFHRRRCLLSNCPAILPISGEGRVRLRLLAAYLRLADALHVDQTRAPDDQYAVMLAYDIPRKEKLHWLRSKFIIGIDVDPGNQEIVVYFKRPVNREVEDSQAIRRTHRTLDSVYNLVMQDLENELNTVQEPLFKANISYYLRVTKQVVDVESDEQLARDIESIFNFYHLLDNPSSSALSKILLGAVGGILEAYQKQQDEKLTSKEQVFITISAFLDDVEESVLKSRRCHTGLRLFVDGIREILKTKMVEVQDLVNWIEGRNEIWEETRDKLRRNAMMAFQESLSARKKDGKVNILLYGYSELVIKALCGFRDAEISKLASKDGGLLLQESGLDGLEKKASDIFRIFVCEGQPKNNTSWGGRIVFHDGIRYAQSLAEKGFPKIYVVPDAVASTLMMPDDLNEGVPRIDFVMVGANGFDHQRFRHSAGHLMVVASANFAKQATYALGSGGRETPTLILAVSTDKFDAESCIDDSASGKSEESANGESKPIVTDGWKFRQPFGREPVRSHVFVSQDPNYRTTLGEAGSSILFYNPREDSVPIDFVDIVITEKAWLARTNHEKEWDGLFIANFTGSESAPAKAHPADSGSEK